MIEQQTAAIRDLTGCLRQRAQSLMFVHDFTVLELVGERSAQRRAMLEKRRTAVTEGGGYFVDLLEAFRPTLGVSWFNDAIHPSAIGHARIAELMCRLMPQSRLAAASEVWE